MKLVAQVENLEGALMSMAHGRVGLMVGDAVAEIAQQVETLRRRTQETSEDLRKMAQEQEAFAISYHECTKLNAHLQHLATQPQSQQSQDAEKKIRRYLSSVDFFSSIHIFYSGSTFEWKTNGDE